MLEPFELALDGATARGVRKSIGHAARLYSLMRPPRRSRRWICSGAWRGDLASSRHSGS
jgi:hypothetical protein